MGLIAPKTFPPLHADPSIDAMQMEVVGVAADGGIVVRISGSMYNGHGILRLRMEITQRAVIKYAYRRMHDESCPMVETWWYRESGGNKVVDITAAVRKMQVTVW